MRSALKNCCAVGKKPYEKDEKRLVLLTMAQAAFLPPREFVEVTSRHQITITYLKQHTLSAFQADAMRYLRHADL